MSDSCCGRPPNDWEGQFGERQARADLRDYRRNGTSRQTARLIELVAATGVEGARILDIGGGVGAISFELLARGAAVSTQIDASSAYLAAAREEADRRGLGDRIRFVHGDAVRLAGSAEPADIVTLDRVICCDPRLDALVRATAAQAGSVYALVYPHDAWWTRALASAQRGFGRLVRWGFAVWVHPVDELDGLLDRLGFSRVARERVGPFWEVAVFRRG